jgi:signal transduction histidine kinase
VVAFVGIAILAADMATIYSNLNLDRRVSSAAEARLLQSAVHFAEVAALIYGENDGWTREGVATLRHVAEIDDLAVRITDAAGNVVMDLPPAARPDEDARAAMPVTVGDRSVGRVQVSQASGQLLTPAEQALRNDLNRLHLVAGLISAALALGVALYLGVTLSRPLRRIREGADAMRAGDLDVEIDERSDDEIGAVANALNSLAQTLKQEEDLRKESVADLAHELRTPTMGLLARIEAAQDGVLDDEAANLAAMHDEAMRLKRLLDDLSALAEAQRPELLVTREPVDLASIAGGQAKQFGERFRAKRVQFTAELGTATVTGDPRRLEQIVINLLSNALRYTDAGGSVRLRVARDGGKGLLEVTDTGMGIAEEDLPHVFTRFWRGEKSRSRATGGAGIGLAIVDALVRAHGGTITVDSIVGRGSCFRVSLPLARLPAEARTR